MSEIILASIGFVGILLLLYAIGVPIAYSIGLTSVAVMLLPLGPELLLESMVQRMYTGLDTFILLAIPFFLFAGRLMNEIGMTDDIFNFAEELVNPLAGGLGHVNVVVSMIFSGMSGSAVADAAGVGTIEYKAMVDRGYDSRLAAGITSSSATIGPIIPPSIPLIIYGVVANVSVGALFIAGIVPGLLMAISLMAMISVIAHRHSYEKSQYDFSKLFTTFLRAIPAFIAPLIIIGGILSGIFTPTESAVVASLYALLIGAFYYKSLDFESLYGTLKVTFTDTAALLVIIALANQYGFLMTIIGLPEFLTEGITSVTDNPLITLLLLAFVLLVLGTFMETLAIILVTVPIIAPALEPLGIDPLAFGIVMMVALMIGLITPPLGLVLFALERVTDLDLDDVLIGVLPFYAPLLIVLLILILVPDLALVLPRWAGLW